MEVYRLEAACKDYLWGGEKLKSEYHITYSGTALAEAWMLSCHKDGESRILPAEAPSIDASPAEGKERLSLFLERHPEALGTIAGQFAFFPILIKLIDAKLPLSVQVHPDDEYALKYEGQLGKTEMWIILEREEGAFLYLGFKEDYSKEEIQKAIQENYLTDLLKKIPVEKGDVFLIEAGTVHAIGAGILLAEVQENSNLTYRVYDYGRKDKYGKERELHIEKALKVLHTGRLAKMPARFTSENIGNCASSEGMKKQEKPRLSYIERLGSCKYFTVERLKTTSEEVYRRKVNEDSFLFAMLVDGKAELSWQESPESQNPIHSIKVEKGNGFFIPAGSGELFFSGEGEWILSFLEL